MRVRRLLGVAAVAASLFVPVTGDAVTAGPFSACAGSFSGGSSGCGFEFVGLRVMPWAVVAPGSVSVVVEARFHRIDGTSVVLASCTAGSAYPLCLGSTASLPEQPSGQTLACTVRGTGRAIFGCVSEAPIL